MNPDDLFAGLCDRFSAAALDPEESDSPDRRRPISGDRREGECGGRSRQTRKDVTEEAIRRAVAAELARHGLEPQSVYYGESSHGEYAARQSDQNGGSAQRREGGRGPWRSGRGRGRGGAAAGAVEFRERTECGDHHGYHRGRSQNKPRHSNPGGIKYMTREDIERLARSDSQELIRYITENERGFLAAYSYQRFCSHPLMLKYLIKFLYLLVKSDDNDLAARIVAQVFGDSVSVGGSIFRTSLDTLIRKMPTETRMHIVCENPRYLNYLIEIGTFAISAIPVSVMHTFPYLYLKDTIERLSLAGGIEAGFLVPKARALAEDFTNAPEQVMPQPLLSTKGVGIDDSDIGPPPQHITELSVLPTTDEIHPQVVEPYLRPNITTGAYTDWEHYLDVQFRLMREDFVAPLRDGIRTLELKGAASKHLTDVRIYERVSVCNTVCLLSGIGFQIQFDTKKFRKLNWEHSNRLIFGSLLCFSHDNFGTIYFATVVKRDPKLLKDGLVTVQFEGDNHVVEDIFQVDPNEKFVMVESTAYFEAYRHILEGIKRASIVHLTDRLQIFKKYLIDCQITLPVPLPRYLRISDHKCFRLKEVINIKMSRPDVVVTDDSSWPPHEYTSLDPSQLQAFRAALTQEVSVIQGPPGTGKTYIGLKVVEALIANKEKFQSNSFPILVLCYTNHALDQFLEGILAMKTQEHSKLNIIRIGGRCKTKNVENCVLKVKRDEIRAQKALPHHIAKSLYEARNAVQKHQVMIEMVQKKTEALQGRDKVLKLRVLENYIQPHHLYQLTQERLTFWGREIDVWLNLWHVPHDNASEPPPTDEELHPESFEDVSDQQSESEDEFIQVDAEANMLADQRMVDGEELELPRRRNRVQVQHDLFVPDTYDQQQNEEGWSVVQISKDERHRRIKRGHSNKPMSPREANAVTNIWQLNLKRRWSLYLHWVNELKRANKRMIANQVLMYNVACKEYTECYQEIDAHVIKTADIVGMTTTGAAKHNHILSNMLPKIVIIEEAAEVFEAHVFTSLTPSVQQLIMIGDHKQLRPKANCYKLDKKYEFCVSLFERLARNGFPVHTLEVQHRMRPEIASLICPVIYEKLLNNENVEVYDHVKGVGSDLFFIDHTFPEKANEDRERSHSNLHEADYLVALCKYLLKQGYLPSEITVLTMYRGQLLELRKRMRKQDYGGVRVAAVDDFQGEENEIILLSLVRSNSDGKIGFLNIENRICVSLSRAKIGFFVIGNLSMLRDKNNTVWPQILADLSRKGCIGPALPLHCQVHPKNKVMASTAEDFLKCPEGGCQQKCAFRLNCGHSCPRLCHPIDQEHLKTKCNQKCPKVLQCGHICRHKCFECKEGCLPCSEPVLKKIAFCGHEVEMPCHQNPLIFACTKPCNQVLNCGHKCQELCSRVCSTHCRVDVVKSLLCGHTGTFQCYSDPSIIECKQPCDTLLDCGHKCPGQCGKCQRGRLHVRCQSECGRTLVCSHVCNFPCTPTCPPCMEKCNNYCGHSRCQRKCYEPCVPCMEPCKWKCKHLQCSRLCSEMCDRPPCNKPCKRSLKCGHPCIGLCGEKCPSKCRVCDRDEVCEIFFGNEEDEDAKFIQFEECGHVIEVTACDAWMKQQSDGSKPAEVQFKSCPKCKTQIRKSLRYGNIVKQTLQDYENIKKQQLQVINPRNDLVRKFQKVKLKVQEVSPNFHFTLLADLLIIADILLPNWPGQTSLPPHQINNISTQLSFFSHIVTMVEQLSSVKSTSCIYDSNTELDINIIDIQEDINRLIKFLMQDFLSNQQISDIESEMYRLMSLIKLLDLWCKIKAYGKYPSLTLSDKSDLTTQVQRIRESGWKTEKLKEKDHDDVAKFVTTMSDKYKVSGLTDTERIEIVKAVGLSKGHWFKCPNGHYYCIGDCGGAMEEAECPECGAMIGGLQHTLRSDNQLAPEMDGARHSAWSEFANLANFDPQQFM